MRRYILIILVIINMIVMPGCLSQTMKEEDKTDKLQQKEESIIQELIKKYNAVEFKPDLKYTIEAQTYLESTNSKPVIFKAYLLDIIEENNTIYLEMCGEINYSLESSFKTYNLIFKCSKEIANQLVELKPEIYESLIIIAKIDDVEKVSFKEKVNDHSDDTDYSISNELIIRGKCLDYSYITYDE